MAIYLGIDIGTSGTKAIAIDPQGKVLATASASYPCHHPRPLWSEQAPDDWWRAVVETIRQIVKQGKLKKGDVKGIGLSGQMHGSVFLDRHNKVLRPAILWNDQRTAAECEEIERRAGGRKKLIGMVANPALTGFTAPKILWLRNHEPKHFDRLAKVLLPKDEIRRRLTGEYATEVSDASGTLLLDVAKRSWSRKLLQQLDLDPTLLPEVYESHQVTGTLTPQVAEMLGLSTDCLVVGGAGDCAAGAIGNGIVKKGIVSTSLGTSGVVFAYSETPQVDPQGRLHTFCHAVEGKWHMMGVTLSAAGSLEWLVETIEGRAGVPPSAERYRQYIDQAAAVPAGSDGLYFLPYLSGERTPHADPLARGAFVGLTLSHTQGHLTRSVLEGVTYSLRDCLAIMEEMGIEGREIRTTGGGAKSEFWRQMQADMFGKRVVTMASDEGPCMGVALLAAVGGGEYRHIQEACAATVALRDETRPRDKVRKQYEARWPIYQQLYRSLKQDFSTIAQLES